jgi:hypothetical protein
MNIRIETFAFFQPAPHEISHGFLEEMLQLDVAPFESRPLKKWAAPIYGNLQMYMYIYIFRYTV